MTVASKAMVRTPLSKDARPAGSNSPRSPLLICIGTTFLKLPGIFTYGIEIRVLLGPVKVENDKRLPTTLVPGIA